MQGNLIEPNSKRDIFMQNALDGALLADPCCTAAFAQLIHVFGWGFLRMCVNACEKKYTGDLYDNSMIREGKMAEN